MTRIPKTWLGEEIKGSLERVLSNDKSQPTTPVTRQTPLVTKANINLSDYVKIPGTTVLIQKYQSENGLNWEDTHYKLAENGLFMPTPFLMMRHLVNVIDAFKGNAFLFDGNGPIPLNETEEIYHYLTKNNKGGVWSWLDMKFKEPSNPNQGSYDIETNHRVILNGSNKELTKDISQSFGYVVKDCYVDLEFNQQGLPIKISDEQKYQQSRNIYFYKPRKDTVAGFRASSDGAFLSCVVDPAGSGARLGVLACAEGTEKKI